jgi:hypothetical protein
VVASGSVLAAVVAAFGHVQGRAVHGTTALASEVGVVTPELVQERTKRGDEVEENGIDSKHG